MSALRDLQARHARYVARLILEADEDGFVVTLGEAERPEWVARVYAEFGRGIVDSLHRHRLATDLQLYLPAAHREFGPTNVTDWIGDDESAAEAVTLVRPLGERWKSYHPDHAWGGDFQGRPDVYHFSTRYGGRA